MSWYRIGRDGVAIELQVQPGARRTEIVGLHGDCLKLRLAAPPADGKANACLIEFLAQRLGVKKGQVTITRGAASRRKTVFVAQARFEPRALLQPDAPG